MAPAMKSESSRTVLVEAGLQDQRGQRGTHGRQRVTRTEKVRHAMPHLNRCEIPIYVRLESEDHDLNLDVYHG